MSFCPLYILPGTVDMKHFADVHPFQRAGDVVRACDESSVALNERSAKQACSVPPT